MEVITFGIIIVIALVVQSLFIRRWLNASGTEPTSIFELPKPTKRMKKPRVRDDLSAWRQEQEERYEWEEGLRNKEIKAGR